MNNRMGNCFAMNTTWLRKLIPTFALLCAVFSFVNGADFGEGYYDYGHLDYLKDQPPSGHEGQELGNETLTIEEAEYMIKQAVKDTRNQVLTDPELKTFIEANIKKFLNIKLNCIKKEGYYFDYGVPDCKSCHRENCKADQLCETECRDFLERGELKQKIKENGHEIEAIKSDVKDLKAGQNERTDQTWNIALVTVIGILAVVIAILIYLVVTRTRARQTERLTRTSHPLSDVLAEGRRLLGFGRSEADNGDRTDGNQA